MDTIFYEYAGLFGSAFLAATVIPIYSEVVISAMAVSDRYDTLALLIWASTGNTLGSVVNWLIGRYCRHWRDRKWFPIKPHQLDRATEWFNKWGLWSLLLAWTPVLGDPLTFVAGILRVPFWTFLILVAISKTGRYAVLLGLVGWLF
ncbi:MAG: YqaA family protein [Rhodospirillales bacterium]